MKRRLILTLGGVLAAVASAPASPPFIAGLARQPPLPETLAGIVLLTDLGCTACHAHPSDAPTHKPKPGPDLTQVGSRVAARHLQAFIAGPTVTKPGTTMPDVLRHLPAPERDTAAEALAHYLATLGAPPLGAAPLAPAPAPEAVARGRTLFQAVGCVACHAPEASSLLHSVPLGPLAEKYSVPGLAHFIEDPLSVRPGGRMPDLRLDHFEAMDIASYLLREQTAPRPAFPTDQLLVNRGQELFGQHRCGACHTESASQVPTPALPLDRLRPDQGCLSRQIGPWPAYDLSEAQLGAVRVALGTLARPLDAAEHVTLTLTRLNCLACHEHGERGGVPAERNPFFTGHDENLGDQGRLPPPLTGVGAKLRPDWLREVLVNGATARPYLHTRMPRFGAANVEALVGVLRQLDPPLVPPALKGKPPQRPHEIGRELAGGRGFSCVSCHTFRGQSAAAIKALDLMTMATRLEEGWFHQYLAKPQRFSPLTIMPEFWPDNVSTLPEVLGGDPDRQRDALWQYLAQGPEANQPHGLILEPLVLAVANEAVILRRAYPGIGKRGIGVGYPAGVNLAFDAEQLRLGSIWSGGFIEASALWRGQGAGQAHPLGRNVVRFPAGPAFALLPSPDTAWPTNTTERPEGFAFKGYSLDAARRPTFHYRLGPLSVEDCFLDRRDPAGNASLERTIRFPAGALPTGLHFRVAADPRVELRAPNVYAVGPTLLVHLPTGGVVRDAAGGRELLLPVSDSFTLEYHLSSPP